MTLQWYKDNGYNVSINMSQAVIDRAEKDVYDAYVKPILPEAVFPFEEGEVMMAVADVVFLLVMQRSTKVTRSGAKEKTSANSQNAGEWSVLSEQASTAALAVDRLRAMPGSVKDAEVTDIAKIYFKTQYFYS